MTHFDKIYHPPGTAPGTLVSHEGADTNELKIHLIDYTGLKLTENELASVDECKPYLGKNSVTWIHMQGPIHAETIQNIGDIFKLHPLALEDVLNKGQRPKVEEHDNQLFAIMAMPVL